MGERRYPLGNEDVVRFGYDDYRYGCLCTFPYNYRSEKIGISEVESFALLGAALCLYNNDKSKLSKDSWMGDEYVLPDCLPLWIREGIKEAVVDYPEKFDNGKYDIEHVSADISNEEYKKIRIERLEAIKKWCEVEIEEIKNEPEEDEDICED